MTQNLSKSAALQWAVNKIAKLEKRLNDHVAVVNKNTETTREKFESTTAMLPQLARSAVAELVDRGTAEKLSSTVAQEYVAAATEKADAANAALTAEMESNHQEIHEGIGRLFSKAYDTLLEALAAVESGVKYPGHPTAKMRRESWKIAAADLRKRYAEAIPTMKKVASLLENPKRFDKRELIREFWDDRRKLYAENAKLHSEFHAVLAEARKETIALAKAEVEFG